MDQPLSDGSTKMADSRNGSTGASRSFKIRAIFKIWSKLQDGTNHKRRSTPWCLSRSLSRKPLAGLF